MKKWSFILVMIMALTLLLACKPPPIPVAPSPPEKEPPTNSMPDTTAPQVPSEKSHLLANPVEDTKPVYGGTLKYAASIATNFDAHQRKGWAPMTTLPVFNALVMYDTTYMDTVPENIIGDLAESWETSADGREITFKLHQGVKWHDGMPCTTDDVVYSLDKMVDSDRSRIADQFPAYESAEKIDDYTVKVHLKSPSAGFMISLASGYAQIQAKHTAGLADGTSADFMMGTGPYTLDYYEKGVGIRYKKNPDYFKKDQYGNQMPYFDGIDVTKPASGQANEMFMAKRIDMKGPVSWVLNFSSYQQVLAGSPEAVFHRKVSDAVVVMFLNMTHEPLGDLRVRRALGLLVDEEALITAHSGHVMFGTPNLGLLQRSFGLPEDEIIKVMGWDKSFDERVTEAKKLMAEAGYPNGFKLKMLSALTSGGPDTSRTGANKAYAETLRQHLNIDVEIIAETSSRHKSYLSNDDYDLYTANFDVEQDPTSIANWFGTDGDENWSHYSHPEVDKMLAELDAITDPAKRRTQLRDIEYMLLSHLPALPTGEHINNRITTYPYVKNFRLLNMSYSNACRFEDVWFDPDIYQKFHGKPPA